MATLHLTNSTTVDQLRKEFNASFGSQIKLYSGNKVAEADATLDSIGLTVEGQFECRSSLTVASFVERINAEFGLKVKVYTCDEWVAVLDGLTLESSGKVKKNAVKKDMEDMIAYQRSDNSGLGGYTIQAEADGGYMVFKDGVPCDNAKAAMREIAGIIGFDYDAGWTTRQFGSKLIKAIEGGVAESTPTHQPKDNTAEIEAAKAQAEAAKAELARIQAEAAKAQAEAEKAKAATAKAKADAEVAATSAAKETVSSAAPAKTSSNKGALNGLFSVAENKKVRFSMGNLQFNAKKYEFRFAEHQWERIGNDNTKIATNYDGWIDLFGYGTSGYMGCEPTETNTTGNQYPRTDIANTNYDWGVYNPISNGGNKEGIWRTMSRDEWYYLMNTRLNAAKLRARANVNGINGAIFLPDDFYEHRVRVPFDSTPDNFAGNTYDLAQWAILEEAGAIFLPCCGERKGTTMTCSEDTYWSYWTATVKETWSYYAELFKTVNLYQSYYGRAVRMVLDVK